jgi:Tfp pilus assembly protein PilO
MIRRLSGRERIIFGISLAAVAFAFLYNNLISPLQEKRDFLGQEIMLREKQMVGDLAIVQRSKAQDTKYDAYVKQFSQSGTNEETASSILSEIEGVAGKLGLRVMDLKPKKVQENQYDYQFSVSLAINSGLVDITRFLYILQQEPHFFDVEEVEFEKFTGKDLSMVTTHLVLSKAFIPSNPHKEAAVLYE